MKHSHDHRQLVTREVESGSAMPSTDSWRRRSWARCIREYQLDPSRARRVTLSAAETRDHIEIYNADRSLAGIELEQALSIIAEGGYSAYLANREGVIIAERRSRDGTYFCDDDVVGALWSEAVGGTNGIGTAIIEQRPCAVLLGEHFFAQYTGNACAAAPFFDPAGDILGVVNFSTRNPAVDPAAHRMVQQIAQRTAERIEAKYFNSHFHSTFVLDFTSGAAAPILLAVDEDFCILGATRTARQIFGISQPAIGARSLWAVFEKQKLDLKSNTLKGIPLKLRILSSGVELCGLSRAPVAGGGSSSQAATTSVPAATPEKNNNVAPSLDACAGGDPVMQKHVAVLRRVMDRGLAILLLGETGVGKDTLARAFHEDSQRSSKPFVAFNCAAIPETLIDSELFGYATGAFTGARRNGSLGRLIEADGGTLFLDEIGDMPLALQTRLLRVLETGEVSPLGGGKTHHVDIQVIAATNQRLPELVRQGRFRQDLFYRLAGAVFTIPALRERSDIPQIVDSLIRQSGTQPDRILTPRAMELLCSYAWPGNIRELRNVIRRAVQVSNEATIDVDDLTYGGLLSLGDLSSVGSSEPAHVSLPILENSGEGLTYAKQAKGYAEKAAIEAAIARCAGDPHICAELLGFSRATLYRKLKRYGLHVSQRG